MALSAKQIRVGAVVSGRCGQRRFAGDVIAATDVTITVQDAAGETTEIAPAWADVLVVDGHDTPAPKPIETIRHYALKDRRPLPRLPGNIADIERQRADKNYQAVTEWKAKQKQEEANVKMTPAQKVMAMNIAKAAALADPVKCSDCPAMFKRKALNATRCPECKKKHAKQWREEHPRKPKAAGTAGTAGTAASPKVSDPAALKPAPRPADAGTPNPNRPPEPAVCTCGHRKDQHDWPPNYNCLVENCSCGEFDLANRVKPPQPVGTPALPKEKPVADETCKSCGDYYFPGITGVDGQCRKCLDKKQASAGMAPPAALKPASESTKSTESIQPPPAPASIPSDHSIPSIHSPSGRRRIGLVPITALERAHGQIQALWLEIARLQALVEG